MDNSLKQIITRLKESLKKRKLIEKKEFKVSDAISAYSIKKWAKAENDKKEQLELFKAAKNNEQAALEYIFWTYEPLIQKTFWKNYLGPNGAMRNYRINHESAWEQWLSIAWMTMTKGFQEAGTGKQKGALEGYNYTNKEEDEKFLPLQAFGTRFKQFLLNAANAANHFSMAGGITGHEVSGGSAKITMNQYEPTWIEGKNDDWNPDGDDTDAYGDSSYEDETFDIVNKNLRLKEFLAKWKKFVQDPRLSSGIKGVSGAALLLEMISNPMASYPEMSKKFGISRNSMAQVIQKTVEVMKSEEYEISREELLYAIKKLGNDKISSYIYVSPNASEKNSKSLSNEIKTKEINTSENFLDNFKQCFENPKMWDKTKKEANAGNIIFWWIDENFPPIDSLAEEYGVKLVDANWYFNRGMKILKKSGISEEDIKSAVKKLGKETVTNVIGE